MSKAFEWSASVPHIHQAALTLLERAGILLDEPGMRQRLADAGCRVEGRRVRMPGQVCTGRSPGGAVAGRLRHRTLWQDVWHRLLRDRMAIRDNGQSGL